LYCIHPAALWLPRNCVYCSDYAMSSPCSLTDNMTFVFVTKQSKYPTNEMLDLVLEVRSK
jgi:hypothetical protein